jgi:hypothetical protein
MIILKWILMGYENIGWICLASANFYLCVPVQAASEASGSIKKKRGLN